MNKDKKIVYLFTTFPVLTETFLQREIRVLHEKGLNLEIYSLWGGSESFEGMQIHRFPKWKLFTLLWRIPILLIKRGKIFANLFRSLRDRQMPSLLNCGETLIGISFAIVYVNHFDRERPSLFHAVWATMPATAALLLSRLTGVPFSMGAHAYDVYEDGGDWLLSAKLREASLVRTSTTFTAHHLRSLGAKSKRILLARRGIDMLPARKPKRSPRIPIRLLSIGRLIEKKGYSKQLEIYKALQKAGIRFQVKIVGEGPLHKTLVKELTTLGLEEQVSFLGPKNYEDVVKQFLWADIFVYTGKIARNGDRDGLPNVIPEAMASGVPVIASKSKGIEEVLRSEENGLIIEDDTVRPWISAISRLTADDEFYEKICNEARKWTENNFNARDNVGILYQRFQNLL